VAFDLHRSRIAVAKQTAQKEVAERLGVAADAVLPPLGVSVSVCDGKVTLAGTTSSGSVRKRAEKIAHMVAGVSQIDNRIISVPSHGRI
jgi:hypothetical protein